MLWKIEQWARQSSYISVKQPKLLWLKRGEGAEPAQNHQQKVKVLVGHFFLNLTVDLSDIVNQKFHDNSFPIRFELDRSILKANIEQVLKKMNLWKVPGVDLLSIGFFKVCNKSLQKALTAIATVSL